MRAVGRWALYGWLMRGSIVKVSGSQPRHAMWASDGGEE